MDKHKHLIVLNGHHYNAKTGERLSHPGEPAHAPEASHHAPKPAATPTSPQRPAAHKATPKTARRQSAGHIAPHRPKPALTLMRQTVKKPSASAKRRIRVQGRLDSQIKQPVFEPPIRAAARQAHRAARQRHVKLISHFSPNLFTTVTHATIVTTQPIVSDRPAQAPKTGTQHTMKPAFAGQKPRTTAELLEYAIKYASSPLEPEEPAHRKRARKHRRAHAAAH